METFQNFITVKIFNADAHQLKEYNGITKAKF